MNKVGAELTFSGGKIMNEEMKKGAVIALQGVKEEMVNIVTELNRKGFEKPKGFSALGGYVEDRMNELVSDSSPISGREAVSRLFH